MTDEAGAGMTEGADGVSGDAAEAGVSPGLSPFHRRLTDLFVAPGKLFTELAREPQWGAALLTCALIAAVATVLIPADIQMEAMRNAMLERGAEVPDNLEGIGRMSQVFGGLAAGIFTPLWILFIAGVVTVIFAFLFGDDGTYQQYLAGAAHAFLIPTLAAVAIVPLRISARDPRLMITPGSVLGSLAGEGYLANFLSLIDVFGIWAMVVLAIAVTKIDPKRDFGTAFGVLFGVQLLVAAVFAVFV